MEHSFWHNCWEKNTIGFHQTQWHPYLEKYFKPLISARESTQANTPQVLVPLCGKSADMIWLAQHFNVIGAELSDIACRDFFKEQCVEPERSELSHNEQPLVCYQKENIALYQGDFFALDNKQLPSFDWIFDRAALVALPSDLQFAYVEKLKSFIGDDTQLFLVALEFPVGELQGPPFIVNQPLIEKLFAGYEITKIAEDELADQVFAQRQFKVSWLKESLYLIKRYS